MYKSHKKATNEMMILAQIHFSWKSWEQQLAKKA